MRAAHPPAPLTVWAEDEHRLGLLPVIRRVWAPKGQRPTAWVHRRYQWRYVAAFGRPTTGQRWWCLRPTGSTQAMGAALAVFAQDEGIAATHRAILVLDGAGGPTSGKLAVPVGIALVFPPPASPELQPVERVWSLVDEPVANRTFATLTELEDVLVTRWQTLRADRHRSNAHTRSHGWARERRPQNPK